MKNVTTWLLQELISDTAHQKAKVRTCAPGESIFRAGDPGEFLVVLLSGAVDIRRGDTLISVVEPGSMFGEMGLIDRQPRIADAYAVTHSRIAEIREGQFMALLEATPHFGLAVMRVLTDRLRRNTDT